MMTRPERIRIFATVFGSVVAGGVAGAGVSAHWYGPFVAVGLAVLIGLAAGSQVLRAVLAARRRESPPRV